MGWGALAGGSLVLAHVVLAPVGIRLFRRRGASWALTFALTGILVIVGLSLGLLYAVWGWSLERSPELLWALVVGGATAAGAGAARYARRVPGWEVVFATLFVSELLALLVFGAPEAVDLAGARIRALLLAPSVIGLALYFGASVGYLVWGAGRPDWRFGYEAWVGRRFLLAKASSVLSTVTTISVIGVALGVWLVVVVLAILSGFERDLQDKIIGAGADMVVEGADGRNFALATDLVGRIEAVDRVEAAAPFVEGEVAFASTSNYTAGLLFGIDPATSPKVLSVLGSALTQGAVQQLETVKAPPETEDGEFLPPAPIPSIIVGNEMAKALNVRLGDTLRVVSPLLDVMTPVGMVPRSLSFRVGGIFTSKMYEFDARYAYVSLASARRFFELASDAASGIHVRSQNPERADSVARDVAKALASTPGYRVRDWKQRNQTLFAALKLERVVAFVVLVFVILVASFSIVNTLSMSVIEKQKEIAILKTMGARSVGIMKLFLTQGMLVGFFGTLLGALVALGTTTVLERYGFWIPGDVYYIDSLPVFLEGRDVVLVVIAALLIVWDFAVFPALRGSRLNPVEGLRDG